MAGILKGIRFDFMGSAIAPLSLMLMDISWLYTWLIWTKEAPVIPWTEIPISLGAMVAVAVISYLITKYIPSPTRLMALLKLALVLLTIFAVINLRYGGGSIPFSGDWFRYVIDLIIDSFNTLHPLIPSLFVSAFLAWRGIKIGSADTLGNDMFGYFMFGLIGQILLIIVWAGSLGSDPDKSLAGSAGLFISGFFFFGLIAMAMGNYLNIRRRLMLDKSVPISNRRWLTILLLVIGGVVVLGGGLVSLISPELVSNFRESFGNIVYYVSYPIEFIFRGLSWIFDVIYAIMKFMVDLLKGQAGDMELPEFSMDAGTIDAPEVTQTGFDPMIIVKWAVFILVLALIIFILYKATKRFTSRKIDEGIEEYSESLWTWLGFTDDIRLFFRRLLDRWFGGPVRNIRQRFSTVTRAPTEYPDDMDIRLIYRNMLDEAKEAGHSRHSWETPYEYGERLQKTVPDATKQVEDITDLYVNVRYGDTKLKEWETEHANVMWRLFHRIFRRKPDERSGY